VNANQIVEAVLFASDAPLTAYEIARADETLNEDLVEDALQMLRAEYDDAGRSFQIVEVAEGYQILTRPEFAPYLERFDNVPRPSRLSGPALETLAIIAYRQPLGRLEIEYIRGVSAAGVIKTLQDRRLIDIVGRAEGLGRPILYGTTQEFLQHFGFRSLNDLPRPEELPVVLRDRVPLGDEELELTAGIADDEGVEGSERSEEATSEQLWAALAAPDEEAHDEEAHDGGFGSNGVAMLDDDAAAADGFADEDLDEDDDDALASVDEESDESAERV
jgi:segregation and condensation protein B